MPATTTALTGAASMLGSGSAVTRRQLYFELDYFIPLLIGSVALGNREEFAQPTATVDALRSGRRGGNWSVFGVLCSHQKSKCGARVSRAPQWDRRITSSWQPSSVRRQP